MTERQLTLEEIETIERDMEVAQHLSPGHGAGIGYQEGKKLIAAARKGIESEAGWRTIESAPKERSLTIQFCFLAGPYWVIRQGWWAGEPGVWTDGKDRYRPTHWKRLPAPPSAPQPTENREEVVQSGQSGESSTPSRGAHVAPPPQEHSSDCECEDCLERWLVEKPAPPASQEAGEPACDCMLPSETECPQPRPKNCYSASSPQPQETDVAGLVERIDRELNEYSGAVGPKVRLLAEAADALSRMEREIKRVNDLLYASWKGGGKDSYWDLQAQLSEARVEIAQLAHDNNALREQSTRDASKIEQRPHDAPGCVARAALSAGGK